MFIWCYVSNVKQLCFVQMLCFATIWTYKMCTQMCLYKCYVLYKCLPYVSNVKQLCFVQMFMLLVACAIMFLLCCVLWLVFYWFAIVFCDYCFIGLPFCFCVFINIIFLIFCWCIAFINACADQYKTARKETFINDCADQYKTSLSINTGN